MIIRGPVPNFPQRRVMEFVTLLKNMRTTLQSGQRRRRSRRRWMESYGILLLLSLSHHPFLFGSHLLLPFLHRRRFSSPPSFPSPPNPSQHTSISQDVSRAPSLFLSLLLLFAAAHHVLLRLPSLVPPPPQGIWQPISSQCRIGKHASASPTPPRLVPPALPSPTLRWPLQH